MSVYDILADFAYASALILVGQFLRSKVTSFQKFFIPASMLAGFLGLLLGSQFMNVIHFSDAMGSYAGMLVIPVFVIIGLNGFSKGGGKEGSKEELRRVSGNFFFRVIVFFIQFCLPIAVALTVVKALMTSISDGLKIDGQVFIGGTTSVQPDGSVYGETAYEQARYIFDKMMVLLAKVGAGARDVYRVDYFVTDMAYGADVGRAYSETFHDVKPLCTGMAIKSLNRPTQLVEIELAALVHTVLE